MRVGTIATVLLLSASVTASLQATGGQLQVQENVTLLFPTPTTTSISPLATASRTSHLAAWTAVPISLSVGLIMPNPGTDIYTNLSYTLGFADTGIRPAPVAGGWLRSMGPIIIFPDYSVRVLTVEGSLDPNDPKAFAEPNDQLCGALTVYNGPVTGSAEFTMEGWHMLVINETWVQLTVTNNTCHLPYVKTRNFFATQSFSVKAFPTSGFIPREPPPYTVWKSISTDVPSRLPVDPNSRQDRLVIAISSACAALAVTSLLVGVWWIRRHRFRQREEWAFKSLSRSDRAAFLAENPHSQLNPDRCSRLQRAWGYGPKTSSSVSSSDCPPPVPPKDYPPGYVRQVHPEPVFMYVSPNPPTQQEYAYSQPPRIPA